MIWTIVIAAVIYFVYRVHKSADLYDQQIRNVSSSTSLKESDFHIKTYWERYKEGNLMKAKDIELLLKIDMSKLSDKDAKEKIASVERMAESQNCEISQIKVKYIEEIEKYPAELIPQLIEMTRNQQQEEIQKFQIDKANSMTGLMIKWLEERKYELQAQSMNNKNSFQGNNNDSDAENLMRSLYGQGESVESIVKKLDDGVLAHQALCDDYDSQSINDGTRIDKIAQKIVSSYIGKKEEILAQNTREMLLELHRNEYAFSAVKYPYLVAKSLYYIWSSGKLIEDDQIFCVRLIYFCLLNNYLKNAESNPGEANYKNLVLGCKLAIVLISMQREYLMYDVIHRAGYVIPETHLRNQIHLFGGIIKEAENLNYLFPVEDIIGKYFKEIFKEIYSILPVGNDLAKLRESYGPTIKRIKMDMQLSFRDDSDNDVAADYLASRIMRDDDLLDIN